MYAEPLSGSPRGDLKVEALKQQKLGQIKLLVGGGWNGLSPPQPSPELEGREGPVRMTLPPHFTVKKTGTQ